MLNQTLEPSDEALMRLVQQGNAPALETIYERHHRLALGLAYRIVGSKESAEEIVQESFLTVWRLASSYHVERGKVRDWLLQIVRNRSIDRLRRARGVGTMTELDPAMPDQHLPEVWMEVAQAELRGEVSAALALLPAEQREAIDLAYFAGLSQQEIAERTGAPLGTVKGRMRLAMEKLRQTLWTRAPHFEEQA
ncbi:MAG: sigma-70 family RNA polymerase sigma factor [Chloroflexota bacterium]